MSLSPSQLWFLSTRLHRRGLRRTARLMKLLNYVLYRAVLPPEAELVEPVRFGHAALGVVVHPYVSIGRRVTIWHRVTLSVSDRPGSGTRLFIGDDVEIGAGAAVVTRLGESMRIVNGVRVGANATLTRSALHPGSYVGVPARLVARGREGVASSTESVRDVEGV